MAKADIWMPFYVADYLADTMHLSAAEHGGYLMLILHYWRTGQIPNDPERLANISRLGNAWSNASSTLLAFFEQENGMLIHHRIDREKLEALSNKDKNKARAKAAADKRWANHAPSNASSNATQMLESCPSPSPSPTSIKALNTTPTAQKPRLDLLLSAFEEFWSAYPQRPGASKADTLKAWKARIKESVSASAMMDGAARYKAYCIATGTEPQYIKQPATFIGTGKHYESDWTPPKPSQQITSWQDKKQAADDATAAVLYGTRQERIIEGVTL